MKKDGMYEKNYLLLGMGIGNSAVKKFFDHEKIKYSVVESILEGININQFDIIVKSSGIKMSEEIISSAIKQGINVVTDLELFSYFTDTSSSILVTGSNGKTTTVKLLENCIDNSKAIGNIGCAVFEEIYSKHIFIIESSSFMLECVKNFHPHYVILLNITKTHLEHHENFKSYVRSKLNSLINLNKDDYVIYNYDDILLRRLIETYEVKKVPFSLKKIPNGVFLNNKNIYYNNKLLFSINNSNIMGEHNIQNIMAVVGVVLNSDEKNIKNLYKNIISFKPLPFRIELIKRIGNVLIYNDSKSTNFHALSVALNCFREKRVCLIVGGKLRKDNYSLIEKHLECIKEVFCFGEMKHDFYNYFSKQKKQAQMRDTLEKVVRDIDIKNFDVILFSPASSSYDQYQNFVTRGKHFTYLINKYLS